MGLRDLLKGTLTGASDEDNRKNEAKMWETFSSLVADGDAYMLIYCHIQDSHNAVVAEINMHSNYIMGYRPGEVAIVPVNVQLTKWGEAEVFNEESGGKTAPGWTGYCPVSKEDAHYQLEPITYGPGIEASAKYSVAVT